MRFLSLAILVSLLAPRAFCLPPDEAQKLFDKVSPSLVVVQYTMDGEFGRREVLGQGVVVGEEGLVMFAIALAPPSVPDEQMKEFKIILPGDEEKEIDAEFLGRDDRCELAYVKTKQAMKWPAIKFVESPLKIAEEVVSVGLLPKEAGFKPYYMQATVSANVRGPVPYVLVSPGGLATVGSPVLTADGRAVGFVNFTAQGPVPWLNRGSGALQALGTPSRLFVPSRDFLQSLQDPPKGQPLRIPWIGAQMAGLTKEVAEYYNLKNTPAAQVGEIIPSSPAGKAGLKTGDKIVKLDGKPLERGDEPEETAQILFRRLRWQKVGETVTLSVLREKDKPTVEVKLVLEEQPKQANLAKRFYAEDLGMSVREIVFADTYVKHVPADTQGVVVAWVRPSSSAATAGLKVNDLVTQMNKQPIAGLEELKKAYRDFRQKSPKEMVVLEVMREQRTEVIKIEPPQ